MKAVTKDKVLELPEGISKILQDFQLTADELVKISQTLKICRLKKRELFCEAGKVCDKIGILLEGLLMANFNTVKGTPNVSRFFYSPDNIIITSFESFKTKKVSEESIIAIEDSTLIYLTIDDLEQLYSLAPSINKIARHFAEESYMAALRRIHDLQVLNNQERIEKFFHKQKGLFNRVTKKDIASYLRVNRNDLTNTIAKLEEKLKW